MTDLTVISSMATGKVLAELASSYENAARQRVSLTAVGGIDAARRVRAGERFDVVVLAAGVMEELTAEDLLVGPPQGFATSGIAIAVPSGSPRPSLASEDSVRAAMLTSRRICYSTGPSGDHLQKLWARWGIADQLRERVFQSPPGVPVGAQLAEQKADLGFQQLSELLGLAGVDVVGLLPPSIQAITMFSAAVSSLSPRPVDAARLVEHLTSPEAAQVLRKQGMETP
jgi:molybdate transport system substrate-binding protein